MIPKKIGLYYMKCFDVGMKDGSMGRMCGDENGMKTKKNIHESPYIYSKRMWVDGFRRL